MNWYIMVFKRYADFKGRSQRAEYWYFVLFNFIVSLAVGFIAGFTGLELLSLVYVLAVIIPSIAVGVRRLHDTGRTGWWMLLCFIPIIGPLVLLFFFIQDSHADANAWGVSPKYAMAEA